MNMQELVPGIRLQGRWPTPVEVLSVNRHGQSAASIVVRGADGFVAEEMVFADDLGTTVTIVDDASAPWSLTADPVHFKLATEALRIRMAGVSDPMLAVATSDISPLPHQIRAVYGELLPRTPLRFLLADDPGAGKTVMAGLYAKELILRGDLARMLIIAPGGLVDQWQEELDSKFGITTTLLTRELVDAAVDGDPFAAHPFLVARMDQLARAEDLLDRLAHSEWDLVIVDEAHRMSANWWGGELRKTRRFDLGQLLGTVTRHLLLMTATPHAGSEDNFQAFLSLLDPDRFEGQARGGGQTADTTGLMRRMVKEELLTFEGRPLFPERIAETVPYALSAGERELYEAVTHYVRAEMNRADQHSDSPQRRTVGFALTVLQRRLASSTHAILRSLERRRARLATKRAEMASGKFSVAEERLRLPSADQFDDPDEYSAEEFEHIEEEIVDAATAARTVAELDVEIRLLDELVALAKRVRDSGIDRKWSELSSLLTDKSLLRAADGSPRKLIVFTEHRDTLDYLTRQIRNILGDDDAVLTIHGGTRRTDRKIVRELFTQEPSRQVLVATDAAGEGLNLQAAHLMINYDLPWNPNRLEQRFGRIHRIGQQNVCRLWNIVADETREGQVFVRLLEKMEQQRKAYGGKLFDVLGDAFAETPLRTLLMDAIRYGDDPARIAEIERVVDAKVSEGCEELVHDRALARETLNPIELDRLRREMDDAMARRLQPHYIEAFFTDAFGRIGGRLSKRERGRFQITNVPSVLRNRQVRREHAGRPVVRAYERVTFEPGQISSREGRQAELLTPAHPLFDAVLDATVERASGLLEIGTTLFEPMDAGTEPYVVMAMTGEVLDGHRRVVSKRFSFVSLHADGSVADAGPAPHLDLAPVPESAQRAVSEAMGAEWIRAGLADRAMGWAASVAQPEHLTDVRSRLLPTVEKTAAAVKSRLVGQVNFLDSEAARIREVLAAGGRKPRQSPDRLEARARELELRLATRLTDLERDAMLAARPPVLSAVMLVIPAGMVGGSVAEYAKDTTVTDLRAVTATLAAERSLGREPEEMPHNNKGYDIRSVPPLDDQGERGPTVLIEVKGRIEGASHFSISYNQVLYAQNTGVNHRLALVRVSQRGPEFDEIRYLTDYFRNYNMGDTDTAHIQIDWDRAWAKGKAPH
ncbi:helicase-related protein [Rhodococcoides yunnanense]|uniref:helicase-related protein n=1 Tax=Rhodococcoides yunnanense TaxID=278209 RepID=UPI000933141D|nr:helicase-related protein [Rhodococcus yunnanensis]